MKRLATIPVVLAISFTSSPQSFPAKNVNNDYVVTNLVGYDVFKDKIEEVLRDNSGLYWFQSITDLSSFDGINWRSYKIKTPDGRIVSTRFNDIEVTSDGTIWLATGSGIFVFDRASENFIPLKQKFPGDYEVPVSAACIYKGLDNIIFMSLVNDGFYFFDWQKKSLKHVSIDTISKSRIPSGYRFTITADRSGNFWGITTDNKGIWHYHVATGKISCSWKGELLPLAAKRLHTAIKGITWTEKGNTLWISYGDKGILEKMNLSTGQSSFYSFSGDLHVNTDTISKRRFKIGSVMIDREKNEWIVAGEKYLVKLSNDLRGFEYLVSDPKLLPLGEWNGLLFETYSNNSSVMDNTNLLWVIGQDRVSILKKINNRVKQIPFDSIAGVRPGDYENQDTRKNIFFEKGLNNNYFLLQQNQDRPKLICFDENLQIKNALSAGPWKQYPAYFNTDFNPDNLYIALMRPDIEPLDFRTVVVKDFRIDLNTFRVEELKLNFRERVWRYGCTDANGISWLFSNGYLYSYDPENQQLDSLFICRVKAYTPYTLELVKGYDYPTVLHKNSSTFWIDLIPTQELYKIDLKTRRVEKIFNCCADRKDCMIPSGIFDMYNFDSSGIYCQFPFSAMLINPFDNSVTDYTSLFKNKLAVQTPSSSAIYKDWIIMVMPSHVYFLNRVTGKQKIISINKDFKGSLSQFNGKTLVNDQGELVIMSSDQKKFLVFNIDSVSLPEKPGIVRFSYIKLNNKHLLLDSLMKRRKLSVKYNGYSSIYFRFSDYSIDKQDKLIYEYTLYNGGDTIWNKIEGVPELTLTRISSGNYQLLLRAGNGYGDYSDKITSLGITIIPPFTQTIWFIILIITAIGGLLYGLYRYRLQQLNKLQLIRNNIASDLHDDIGSTLNSISIYSEVAKQQADRDIPALDLIGLNSRNIVENMSDIVWTINPENDSFEKIIIRMRSFAYQVLKARKIDFTFEADEQLNNMILAMQVRKNFYLVFKEAITNIVKYSGATRVSIVLGAGNRTILLSIRDNGSGIKDNADIQGNGLLNMKRRAREINASLLIESGKDAGTAIELLLKR